MAPQLQDASLLNVLYSDNRTRIIKIICQTLIYGIYLCLVPIAVYIIASNGLRVRRRKWLFAMTTSMFTLTTVCWILAVVFTFMLVDLINNSIKACYGGDSKAFVCLANKLADSHMPTGSWLLMLDDILLINYIIADVVVIWRAWVLCPERGKIVLTTSVVMVAINTVIYLVLIVLRAVELSAQWKGKTVHTLSNAVDIIQVVNLMLSLLINIFATSIITLKAWKHRKFFIESGVRTPTKAIRIFTLLVESGLIYILFGVTSVISSLFMHFRQGGISTIILPVSIQLIGIYPIIVVLLVEQNRSLDCTSPSFGATADVRGGRPPQAESMRFAPGPVLASGGQIDSAPGTEIHVTFDYVLESGDGGMGVRSSKLST